VPSHGALLLDAPLHAQQRGNGLDAVVPGGHQARVVHDLDARGEARIILGVDADLRPRSQVREHRRHQLAGGALSLHECHDSIRERGCRHVRRIVS
jgi:hypothetical protein